MVRTYIKLSLVHSEDDAIFLSGNESNTQAKEFNTRTDQAANNLPSKLNLLKLDCFCVFLVATITINGDMTGDSNWICFVPKKLNNRDVAAKTCFAPQYSYVRDKQPVLVVIPVGQYIFLDRDGSYEMSSSDPIFVTYGPVQTSNHFLKCNFSSIQYHRSQVGRNLSGLSKRNISTQNFILIWFTTVLIFVVIFSPMA